jgi:hypothetical protein
VLVKIFFHDACFDGTASTALFARFYRDVLDPRVAIQPVPVQHRDGDPFAGLPVDGDDNACVDFRYCPSPRMRWWFDHHRTAFQPPTLRALFEADRSGTDAARAVRGRSLRHQVLRPGGAIVRRPGRPHPP